MIPSYPYLEYSLNWERKKHIHCKKMSEIRTLKFVTLIEHQKLVFCFHTQSVPGFNTI